MPIKLSTPHHDEDEARIEIVPLIDIMFFLLASMMLVSLGAVRLKLLKADLPVAVAGKPSKSAPPVTITVDKDGYMALDGKALPVAEATELLRRMVGLDPELRLVVAADKASRHEFVLRAIDLARSAGIDRIAFAAKAGDDSQTLPRAEK